MSTSAERKVARRPGGRTADVTQRVHEAVRGLLIEGGTQACTYSSIAERAGIERSTLYRRYPDRWDMLIDAFIELAGTDVVPTPGESFAEDLESVLRKLATLLRSPVGPAMLTVAAELRADSRDDVSRAFFDRRVAQLDPMFDAAIARGELPADVDREALFTFAAGPIYFRMFIAARTVDGAYIRSIAESVCWLYCSGPAERSTAR
ncbi:MAG: TetR-like C-terminal domain-containing protein [Sphingomicrobium sp.]